MFLVRKGFHYRQTLSFSSKVNSNKKSSTKLAVPVLLLSAIALFGPGYFLIKPKIEKKLISEEQLKENVELNYPKGCSFSQYILVGGGTSAIAALEAIREKEPQAKVLIISKDKNEPYQRPPLTKELWWDDRNHENDLTFMNWQGRKTSLFYLPSESYSLLDRKNVSKALSTETSKVHLLLDTSVKKIDTESKNITLDNGEVVFFNKILVATGSRPFLPSFLENMDQSIKNRVMTYRGIEDFKMLTEKVKECRNIVVVGGGFLGTELSYSLKKKAPSLKITQIFPEEGNLSLILPSYLSKWTSKKLSEKGVLIQAQSEVVKINEGVDGCVDVIMNDGGAVTADLVIVSAGSVPNVELARKSNLEIDPVLNGIIANAELESRTGVFSAGDCTSFHDIALGRRRIEHYDHAFHSGRTAGFNMTGLRKPYDHQPMFWSNIGKEIQFEAVGILDSKLKTVSVWNGMESSRDEFEKGVVYYLKDRKVCGILLWNTFGKIDKAREIILSKKLISDPSKLIDLLK